MRYYGLFASGAKAENLTKMRELLGVASAQFPRPKLSLRTGLP